MNVFREDLTDKKLLSLLDKSRATPQFKQAVKDFAAGRRTDLIQSTARSPRIKVLRVVMKLLDEFKDEPIEGVEIDGVTSCSGYSGKLVFEPDCVEVRFNWNCHWKAEQEGFTTWYGQPDQSRAAQRFGYQCFQEFQRLT